MDSKRYRVTILPAGEVVSAPAGEPLLDTLRSSGVLIDASCGGAGTCGRCEIHVVTGTLSERHPDEVRHGKRLACRAEPMSEIVLRIPAENLHEIWRAGPKGTVPAGPLHLAVDIGTTTLSAAVSGPDGEPALEYRTLNPQGAWGSDVLRRLFAARDPRQAEAMKDAVRRAVLRLVARLQAAGGFRTRDVGSMALAGNSAMSVLFLGMDPFSLSEAPFQSGIEALATVAIDPAVAGLSADTRAFMLPGISSFVGADVTAGLLACALDRGPRPALFLDAGTNGEIVVVPETGPPLTASAAAGPAFEGGHLSCGGPGTEGAAAGAGITPEGSVRLDVIGGGAPRWICGTGLLQLLAGLLDAGMLRPRGHLVTDAPGVEKDGTMKYVSLGWGPRRELRLTQADVREVQLAVAAIRSGWRTLLDRAGVAPRDLKRIVVTGSFGKALDESAARRIGLLPDVSTRIEALGSGAIRGLLRASVGLEKRERWESLVRGIRHVPLGTKGFQKMFLSSMTFEPVSD